jgi:hypothetical protein
MNWRNVKSKIFEQQTAKGRIDLVDQHSVSVGVSIKWDCKERACDDVHCNFWLGMPTNFGILWTTH